MDKSSLKKALLEAKEIETFATESAKQIMEQEFLPKIESSVRQALLEMEAQEMGEASEVTLDSGASVNVTVGADGKVTIKSADGTAPAVIGTPANQIDAVPATDVVATTNELPATPEATSEVPSLETSEDMSTPEEEEEELFEIVDDTEDVDDEEACEEPTEETGEEESGEEPTEETGEEVPSEEGNEIEKSTEEKVEKISQDMESMKSLLEKILEKIGEDLSPEGDVEIVGNEETGEEPSEEVPGEEPGEEEEEEIMFEFDDILDETKNKDLEEIKNTLSEIKKLEESLEETYDLEEQEEEEMTMEELEEALREVLGADSLEEYGDEHPVTVADALKSEEEELEEYGDEHEMPLATALKDEEEEELFELEIQEGSEEELEENGNTSILNRQGQNKKPETPHKKERYGLKESTKAQYESKLDELKQENESLKSVVNEYKASFVTLRKQMNEVQTFNAKLAYANKVFTKGGLTNEEKTVISEKFDACKTADEAKALYNKLIKESSTVKKPNVSKIQLPKAASTNSSPEKGTLYENDETRRMKKLAGIIK